MQIKDKYVAKTVADLMHEAYFTKCHLLYEINKIIFGDYDTDTDPVYATSFDYYDNSIEVYFSCYCKFDYVLSQELAEFLLTKCGFNRVYCNFLDNTEQGAWNTPFIDGVAGLVVVGKRKLYNYPKNRTKLYLDKEEGDAELIKQWENYKYE